MNLKCKCYIWFEREKFNDPSPLKCEVYLSYLNEHKGVFDIKMVKWDF